jgi:hypothetical protein
MLTQLENDIVKLKERVNNEKIQNSKTLEIRQGQTVQYGQEIQIMHFHSGAYLFGKISVSEFD